MIHNMLVDAANAILGVVDRVLRATVWRGCSCR